MERFPRGITLLLLLALAIRVAWALSQPAGDAAIDRLPDQREYLSLGRNLLRGSLSFDDPRFGQTVYAYRMPGYPSFIALAGGSPIVVRLAQALLDTSSVLAVYLIARHLSGAVLPATFAGALVAFNPFLVYFSGLILSETLFTAGLAWASWFFVHRRWWAGSAVMLAAVMIRPSALMLGPLLAAVAAMNSAGGPTYRMLPAARRALIAAAIVTAVTVAGLLPWAWRNYRVLGHWVWTTTNAGVTLYDGLHPLATGASDQRFLAEMPWLRSMNEVERSAHLARAANDWAIANASRLPRLTLAKIARTWSPVPLSEEFGHWKYALISAMYALPFDGLVLFGLFSPRLSRTAKLLLVAPAIYFTAVHALSVGSLRYRVPCEPELAILAAIGAWRLFSGGAQHRGFLTDDAS